MQSWTAAASPADNHSANSITITGADNGKSYVVGVRAGNDSGQWSGWRNSASAGPYTPDPTPTPTPAPPAAPASVTLTRADGTVTASWNAPDGADRYHVTYSSDNEQSWTAAASPADNYSANSVTISGADNSKSYVVGVRAGNAGGWSGWRNSAAIAPLPAAPANLSVTPGDGYLDIAWDAVTNATAYDVRAKTAGSNSWHDVASSISGTSHRYTTDATIDHIAVRAVNAGGAGPWAEISRSPAHGWLTTVQYAGASAASAQAQSQLAAPTWGTITRNDRPRRLHLNWTAVTGAAGYNVTCSDTDGWSWWQCGSTTTQSATTLTVSNGPNGTPLGKYRDYMVAVRAVTGNSSQASDWENSEIIRPIQDNLTNLTATRGNGSITLSWTPNPWTTGYLIDCGVAVSEGLATYTRCATLTGQDDTATQHSVTISSWTAGGANHSIDNTKTYDILIFSTNKWGQARWAVPLVPPIHVSSADVGQTTAKIIVTNYTGAWWYKRTAPSGDNTCRSVASGTTEVALSSLTQGVAYTYTTYDATGCNTADEIASVSFSTGANVSNLSQASDTFGVNLHSNYHAAVGFTTGNNEGGYTLQSITARFLEKSGSPAGFTAAIHTANGSNPATNATHTLSGGDPTNAAEYTFTCSGSCLLSDNTTYYLVMTATGAGTSNSYYWDTTGATAETNSPSNFGWSIADDVRVYFNNAWSTQTGWTGLFKVTATLKPYLTVSEVTGNTATLTIANYTGGWHYKATSGVHSSCQGPVSGTSHDITNLSGGATYTYSAYSDSGCSTLLATAAAFTTPNLSVSGIGTTTATMLMSNYAGQQWWYRADSGPHFICQGPTSTRNPLTLSSLSVGTAYQYTAYSKQGCSNDDSIIQVSFTTLMVPALTVTDVTNTAATLRITNHSGDWYYKADAAPDNTCKGPVSTTSKNLTGLTSGASYIYKAYSDSGCTTANLLATAASFTTADPHVTNLSSAKSGQTLISSASTAAVAFTTGASANGYTLDSITVPLRSIINRSENLMTVTLHQMSGGGAYSTSSTPSDTTLATLSGTPPTDGAWADTTYTCSGSGCSLSASTTYFVVAKSNATVGYAWAYATTNTETTYPPNSGWDIGYAHQRGGGVGRPWSSPGDYHPVRVDFTANP